MTKREFQDGMNSIQVDYEKKEKLLGQLCEKQLENTDALSGKQPPYMKKEGGKRPFGKMGVPVVAALLACAILVPGVAYAGEILDYFRGNLSQSKELANNVNKNIFQDQDKHISMEVSELLSDGYSTCMTVTYTALDKKGREWLFGDESKDVSPASPAAILDTEGDLYYTIALKLKALEEKSDLPLLSTGFDGLGLEDVKKQTETSRVFSLDYSMERFTNRCRLTYPLCEKQDNTVDLDIDNLLPRYTYKLTGECSCDMYTPTYLCLSKISYSIYGENHGLYEVHEMPAGYRSIARADDEEEEDIYIDSATLYFKNGSSINLIENSPGLINLGPIDSLNPDASYYNVDVHVLSGEYYGTMESAPYVDKNGEEWIKRTFPRLTVDPENVEKVKINGDMYTLSRAE